MIAGASNITGSLAMSLFNMIPKLGEDPVRTSQVNAPEPAAKNSPPPIDVSAITGKGTRFDRVV